MRALDALEGRFAEASNHHSSKTHHVHESLSHDLSQLEAVLAPNSAGEYVMLVVLELCGSQHMNQLLVISQDQECAPRQPKN